VARTSPAAANSMDAAPAVAVAARTRNPPYAATADGKRFLAHDLPVAEPRSFAFQLGRCSEEIATAATDFTDSTNQNQVVLPA
jgi:hypothetical protein